MTSVDEALSYDRDAVGIGRKGTIDKPYLLKAPFWTVDTLFYAIPKEDMDLEFVHCSFLNVDWKSKDESTGLPSLSKEAINETIALVPSFNEQSRLGEFFNNLDSLITLHQRKCEYRSLCGYLSWEQRKLGDVAAVYDGVHQTPDYQDEGVMFLSVENIATLTSQKFISREAFAKDYPVYPKHGDVLMTRIGDIGTSNVVETDDKLAFYVSLALLKPFDVDSYYLDKSLQSPSAKEELYRRTLHIAFPKKINKNQIAEVMLPIPRSRQEQEQIGALFRDLDSLITLHQ